MHIRNTTSRMFSWILWCEITIFYHVKKWLWGMFTGLQRRVSSLSLLLPTCSSYLTFLVAVCLSRKGMSEHHISSIILCFMMPFAFGFKIGSSKISFQELLCIKHMVFLQAKG